MTKSQTYDNYYRHYFKTPSGSASMKMATARYHAKLRKKYPGVGVNRAARMERESREKKS